jgi:hypothetical protein
MWMYGFTGMILRVMAVRKPRLPWLQGRQWYRSLCSPSLQAGG